MKNTIVVATIVACVLVARADDLPQFHLAFSAQRATDILVTTEAKVVDGNLDVLHILKGTNFVAGAQISIPELAQHTNTHQASVSFWPYEDPRYVKIPKVKRVTGEKLIVFLRKTTDGIVPANTLGLGFSDSVVWIEQGHAFAWTQPMNPGPRVLGPLLKTERQVLEDIEQALKKPNKTNP